MTVLALTEGVTQTSGCNSEFKHTVSCHSDDIAVCGADISDATWCPRDCDCVECVICEDLEAAEQAYESCTCPCCCDVPTEDRAR